MGEPLAALLDEVAAGRFPPADGEVTIIPQPSPRDAGVLGFTAHAVVFTDADPDWVRGQLPEEDLAAPLSAHFLHALCARTGRRAHSVDALCLASPLPGPPPVELRDPASPSAATGSPAAADTNPAAAGEPPAAHPRVARALRYRDDLRVWQADGGIVLVGRGLADRWEVAVEVDPARRGGGLGRELAVAARHLVPDGAPLWAQVAPGNAASLRAFLAAGYRPVGAEALLATQDPPLRTRAAVTPRTA